MTDKLILDTEYENSPRRLISIGYIIVDSNNNIVKTTYYIIKHNINYFKINEHSMSFAVHKITNKMCQEEGVELVTVLTELINDIKNVNIIVGHNMMSADISTIRRESIGIGMWDDLFSILKTKKIHDTMKQFKLFNKELDSYTLDSLYKHIFNKSFINHHNALEDCKITFELYKYLLSQNQDFESSFMNYPENIIETSVNNIKTCALCRKNISNHYIVKNLEYNLDNYLFKLYSLFNLSLDDIICTKCYDNIEIIKTKDSIMIDFLTKNISKNSPKFTQYQDTKTHCFIPNIVEKLDLKLKPIYINCPFEEKHKCKSIGGKWDTKLKKWYVNEKIDINLYKQWI